MATGTIGANPGRNDWMWDQSMHQAWVQSFTVGAIHRMIQGTCFIAGFSATTGGCVVWKNSVASFYTTTDSIGAGNQGTGTGGAVHTTSADVTGIGSDTYQFGAYAVGGVFVNYFDNGGATFVKASAISNSTGGTNISAYNGRTGQMEGFGTYFIMETYVRRSGAWVKAFFFVRRSGAWISPDTYVRRSGAWTQVGKLAQTGELDWAKEQQALVRCERGWEPGLVRWDYDHPRHIGVGFERHQQREREIVLARRGDLVRPYGITINSKPQGVGNVLSNLQPA